MHRWVWLLTGLLLLAGCGRPPQAAPLVAVVISDDVRLPKVEGLRSGLAQLGYEGVEVRIYSAGGDRETVQSRAQEAVAAHPAVVVAGGGIEALALKEASAGKVPVVMMGVASSMRSGLVESLVRPGGNVTGLDNQHAELSAKRLELLVKLLPGARRVLLMYDPLVVPGVHGLEATVQAAAQLGVTVEALAVASLEGTVTSLRNLQPRQYDAALLLPGYALESGAHQLAAELERLHIPVMGPLDLEGDAGLLAAYGVSMREQGVQAARFVVKLLRGEAPAQIPVETPDNPVLVVDLRVARRMGLTLSPVGLAFAHTLNERAGGTP
jgi:putative tryptophan/tyrosine transport system substrate-binding protein